MFLTIKQAAERLAVSASIVYVLCREGRLAHVRIGGTGRRGCIRIRDSDLARFLEQARVEPPDEPDADNYRRHLR